MTELRLRIYEIRAGELEEWIDEWARLVVPLRRRHGFDVLGAWVDDEQETFAWLLGRDDYDAANRAYYESAERKAIEPDPARHIAQARELRVRALPLD